MITYENVNEHGQPINEGGEIIPIQEGKPRLFNGIVVIEFDNKQEHDNYLAQTEQATD